MRFLWGFLLRFWGFRWSRVTFYGQMTSFKVTRSLSYCCTQSANSLAPGRCGCYFNISYFQTHVKDRYLEHFLPNCFQYHQTSLLSTYVTVMAWCRQATSHYMRWDYSLKPMASPGHSELTSWPRWSSGLTLDKNCQQGYYAREICLSSCCLQKCVQDKEM